MPKCQYCQYYEVQKFGKSINNKQRFKCKSCGKTFVWKKLYVKHRHEQHWFKLWIREKYTIRQLSTMSGFGKTKLHEIKNFWLQKEPSQSIDYSQVKYIVYDGTYFHKDGCLISLMNSYNQQIISITYASKEGYRSVYSWFYELKQKGLNPACFIMDGERSVIRAIQTIWPLAKIQRCLYHIQREGCRWLRTYPKTQAGKDLRRLLMKLCSIKSIKEQNQFLRNYKLWLKIYKTFVLSLPTNNIAFKDLKRTINLINNAIPNMFHYLLDPSIRSTTNTIEGYYSELKKSYRQHQGLSQKHKIQYLRWYCYYKNQQKINN